MNACFRSLLRMTAFLAIGFEFLGSSLAADSDTPTDARKPLDQQAVREFENRFAEAWRKNDSAKLKEFLGRDFVNVLPNGTSQSADEVLDLIKSGTITVFTYQLENLKVRLYGETAVATYVISTKFKYQGEETEGRYATTDVIVRTSGALKVVSSHSSEVSNE